MNVLHIDASISGQDSVSRQITAAVVDGVRGTTPDVVVTYRDLAEQPVSHRSAALHRHQTGGADEHAPTATELAERESAMRILEEFLAADIVVIGAPMYNFGIPSQLKAWLDCLAVPGRTFVFTAEGPQGLCTDKVVVIASARGGHYSGPSPAAVHDHQESLLTSFLGFIGVTDVSIVRAEGVAVGPEERSRAIGAALAEAAAFATR